MCKRVHFTVPACFLVAALSLWSAVPARADLTKSDPNDVSFDLDIKKAFSWASSAYQDQWFRAKFYDAIDQNDTIFVYFDTNGDGVPNKALRMELTNTGGGLSMVCKYGRMGHLSHTGHGGSGSRNMECAIPLGYLPSSTDWRVRAPNDAGSGVDFAPDRGYYSHL